jgi:hypothetical protein
MLLFLTPILKVASADGETLLMTIKLLQARLAKTFWVHIQFRTAYGDNSLLNLSWDRTSQPLSLTSF